METKQGGYLEVILGPMFSGKTSKLVEIYKQYTFCNIPILVVNHQEDDRYTKDDDNCAMITHDQIKIILLLPNSKFTMQAGNSVKCFKVHVLESNKLVGRSYQISVN